MLRLVPRSTPPPDPRDLPRSFKSRSELNALLQQEFPEAEGELSPIRGGRKAAEMRLSKVDPSRYGRSRNHLRGAVTRLSPYIRHGVFTLVECVMRCSAGCAAVMTAPS